VRTAEPITIKNPNITTRKSKRSKSTFAEHVYAEALDYIALDMDVTEYYVLCDTITRDEYSRIKKAVEAFKPEGKSFADLLTERLNKKGYIYE
jgi:hypothetical protein